MISHYRGQLKVDDDRLFEKFLNDQKRIEPEKIKSRRREGPHESLG